MGLDELEFQQALERDIKRVLDKTLQGLARELAAHGDSPVTGQQLAAALEKAIAGTAGRVYPNLPVKG